VKKLIRARKAKVHKKVAKSAHQEHADNLFKLAHPENPKRQKAFRRTLTHIVLPICLIIVSAGLAIGAEVVRNQASTKSDPPANSVCRVYSSVTGLAAEDSRIGITFNTPTNPWIATFSGLQLNYLWAVNGAGTEFDLSDVKNNKLDTNYSINYIQACAVNPGPAMPPFNSRNALIDQQYRDFFGRKATASELTYWAGTGYTANQIINWFVDQDASKRGPLVRLYKAYYKRWPDAGGYDYWIRKMKSGTTLTKVSDSFATSSEFKNTYGSLSNEQFVILVYNNVLDRAPDTAGYNYWVKKLNDKKISRGGVMLQFSESSEFKRKYGLDCELVGVTLRMLRRPATDAELQQWNPDLDPYALAYPVIFESSEYEARIVK